MILRALGLASLVLLVGCAKFPEGVAPGGDTRILFSMTVAGEVRSDYVYIVAIRASEEINPAGIGPQPVVTFPSANGFVAGGTTHFVRWDPLESRAYILYRFIDPSTGENPNEGLTRFAQVGIPITQTDVAVPGGRTLAFELSTQQLSDTVASAEGLEALQVNFLTANRVAAQSGTGRVFDALGDTRSVAGVNQTILVRLNTSNTYSESRSSFEPRGDTPDPDLDVVDWTVEVRRQ